MMGKDLYIKSVHTSDNGRLVEANLHMGSDNHPVYFRSNDITLKSNTEAFLVLALPPCMRKGRDVVAEGGISGHLLDAINAIQDIYIS